MPEDDLTLEEELFEAGDQITWNDQSKYSALIENCKGKYGPGPFKVLKVVDVNHPHPAHSQYVWIMIKEQRHKFSGALFTHTP